MLTTQCTKAASSDRHGVSITGQSNVCSTVCSDCQQRISKVRVIVPLWESTVISGSPHKGRVTWKMLLFDDVIMDWRIQRRHMYHITQHITIQPLTKQCSKRGRNVGIPLVSLLSLQVRFLRTITPSVKSNVTPTLLSVEGGHPMWQRD